MSLKTTYYELVKPELTDVADITAMNENWDKIDTELHGKQNKITGAASTVTEDNLTVNRVVVSDGNGKLKASDITTTILGYLSGLKSNAQKQIDDILTRLDNIKLGGLTKNRAVTTDANGDLIASTVTDTEIGYLSGLTSNAQTQLNAKVKKTGDSLTGSLTFNNFDAYHAVHKYRDINNVRYSANMGCGILGGQGIAALEVRKGDATDSPLLGRLEMGDLGVSYVDSEGKRTYLTRSEVSTATVE